MYFLMAFLLLVFFNIIDIFQTKKLLEYNMEANPIIRFLNDHIGFGSIVFAKFAFLLISYSLSIWFIVTWDIVFVVTMIWNISVLRKIRISVEEDLI